MEEKTTKTSKPFRQLYASENDELFKLALKDPLLLAVFTISAIRARRVQKQSPEGLNQFEFWLSETEYAKFGLKETQKGQLARRIMKAIRIKVVSKTGRRTENTGANIYRYIPNNLININPETGSSLELKQGTNRERTGTNNNDNNEKNIYPDAEVDPNSKKISSKETGNPSELPFTPSHRILSYLLKVPNEDVREFIQKFRTNEEGVKMVAERVHSYCEYKGKTYKNYKALLSSALLKDFGKRNTGYSDAGLKIV